jgi:hypothetical protein
MHGQNMVNAVWTDGFGNNLSNPMNVIPQTSGSHSYSYYADNGTCGDSGVYTITVNDLPTINIGPDTNLCGGPVTLDAGAGFSYLWHDQSTNQTITVSSPGVCWVQITDVNGCTNVDSMYVEDCIGIQELTQYLLTVYPNPFTAILNVDFHGDASIDMLVIKDVNGREVYSIKNLESSTIQLDNLVNGVYFLEVHVQGGRIVKRLVKQ